tara:strand:+ start:340 stop:1524 length:1185 start_codon:yes stop_codon:yes gene_type:complete
MKARLSTEKVVHFFDVSSEVGGALVADIVDADGEITTSVSMSQVSSVPNLYLSEPFTLTAGTSYDVVFVNEDVILGREALEVGQPLSDVELSSESTLSLAAQDAGGNDKTVTLSVLDSAGEVLDDLEAPYNVSFNSYTAGFTFEDEGDYFLVWQDDGVPIDAKPIIALKPYGLEHVRFYCATLQGNNGTPHIDTTVVVSTASRKQVAIGVTDDGGQLNVKVPPGTYVVSLFKSGVTYSINNFGITVGDSIAEGIGPRQVYSLVTESFTPTLSDPLEAASMCTLFATIYKMDGTALAHAPIQVRMLTKPQLYDGTTVYDSQLNFTTDSNGRAQFKLIQGIDVEVSIPPMGLRRIISVPSGDDAAAPVNLFTLLSEARDLFDIQKPQIQKAPRRTR